MRGFWYQRPSSRKRGAEARVSDDVSARSEAWVNEPQPRRRGRACMNRKDLKGVERVAGSFIPDVRKITADRGRCSSRDLVHFRLTFHNSGAAEQAVVIVAIGWLSIRKLRPTRPRAPPGGSPAPSSRTCRSSDHSCASFAATRLVRTTRVILYARHSQRTLCSYSPDYPA